MHQSWAGVVAGLAFAASIAASGCIGPKAPPEGAVFGNAVSHNAAQHIIDPDPPSARAGAPDMNGVRAAEAIQRYRSGAVIKPEPVETSTFGNLR
jgi:hypothetical protein